MNNIVGNLHVAEPTPQSVLEATSRVCGISTEDLVGTSRSRALVRARQVAMWACREATPYSYPEIGAVFLRDHTTIMHGVRRVANDPSLRALGRRIIEAASPPPTLFGLGTNGDDSTGFDTAFGSSDPQGDRTTI